MRDANQVATDKLNALLKEVRELAQSRCTCRFANDREPMPVCWRCRIKNALDNYQETTI